MVGFVVLFLRFGLACCSLFVLLLGCGLDVSLWAEWWGGLGFCCACDCLVADNGFGVLVGGLIV